MIDWAVNSAGFTSLTEASFGMPTEDFSRVLDRSGDFGGLAPGQQGPRVERLQKILRKWNPQLGVSATGRFDEPTRKALALYRSIYTENPTGPLDQAASDCLKRMEDGTFWQSPPQKTPAQKMLYQASRALGKPYRLGGDGVNSMDCGLLTSQALQSAGVSASRLADEQYRMAKEGQGMTLKSGPAQAGDVVFFRVPTSQSDIAYGGVTHVGLAIGDGMMLAASSGAGKVVVQPISDLGSYVAGYGRLK